MFELTDDPDQPFSQRGPFTVVTPEPVGQALALGVPFLKARFGFRQGLPYPLILPGETLYLELQLFEFVKVHETPTEQILN